MIKDTIIYTQGDYHNPTIERVIKINADNETEAFEIKRSIYEAKEQGTLDNAVIRKLASEKLIREYRRENSPSYRELKSERNGGVRKESVSDNRNVKNRRGNNSETQENRRGAVNEGNGKDVQKSENNNVHFSKARYAILQSKHKSFLNINS